MPNCRKCGSYTKYNNGLCYSCYNKGKKSGWVYGMERTSINGRSTIYTGQTKRSPYTRWGEHMKSQTSGSSKSYMSKGLWSTPLGAVWSSNREKAERTIKKLMPEQKGALFRRGARKYKRDYW